MFLDDTACNLASLNLIAFHKDGGGFDAAGFAHAVRLWTIVLEISVMMAQYPSRKIAELSYRYRTLGLGYANLGGLLMASGHRLRQPQGAGARRRAHRADDRHRLCGLGRDGAAARARSRASAPIARRCCG